MTRLNQKYRPTSLDDVVGQDVIIKSLIKESCLFVGPSGSGKTTVARLLGRDMEVIEVDCASYSGVDDMRTLLDQLYLTSFSNKKKMIIFDECHRLSSAAWTLLLKPLEEHNIVCIFCSTESHRIPATIKSRLFTYTFKQLNYEDIFKRLKYIASQENITISDIDLKIISKLSQNNLRAAISLLEKVQLTNSSIQELVPYASIQEINILFGNTAPEERVKTFRAILSKGITSIQLIDQALAVYSRLYLNKKDDRVLTVLHKLAIIRETISLMLNSPASIDTYIESKLLCW